MKPWGEEGKVTWNSKNQSRTNMQIIGRFIQARNHSFTGTSPLTCCVVISILFSLQQNHNPRVYISKLLVQQTWRVLYAGWLAWLFPNPAGVGREWNSFLPPPAYKDPNNSLCWPWPSISKSQWPRGITEVNKIKHMPLNCRRHEVYPLETMHIFVPAQMGVCGYTDVLFSSSYLSCLWFVQRNCKNIDLPGHFL